MIHSTYESIDLEPAPATRDRKQATCQSTQRKKYKVRFITRALVFGGPRRGRGYRTRGEQRPRMVPHIQYRMDHHIEHVAVGPPASRCASNSAGTPFSPPVVPMPNRNKYT